LLRGLRAILLPSYHRASSSFEHDRYHILRLVFPLSPLAIPTLPQSTHLGGGGLVVGLTEAQINSLLQLTAVRAYCDKQIADGSVASLQDCVRLMWVGQRL
jgi:hypothetical protein